MKISVIVPSFNQAHYLKATLDSIAAQNYANLEVRIYDGGSSDGSVKVLRKHAAKFWWISEKDDGQAAAINRGLIESSGEVLAFLNSDDVYLPGALSLVANYFQRHPDCFVLYGDAYHLNADGSVMEPYYTEDWNYPRLQEICYLCQPAVFWRREVVQRFGLLDESLHFALDYDYWLRIGKKVPFHYLKNSYLAGSRLHPDTKTLNQRVRVHREILSVVLKHGGASAAVQGWLRHLAHYETDAHTAVQPPVASEQRFSAPIFVAEVLKNAADFGIRLDVSMLHWLNQHLDAAGF
jgi:glycosyltransferase involved in cell wall biosynthesis